MEEAFHTLGRYTAAKGRALTLTMEDYMEMIYRGCSEGTPVRVGELARRLSVQPSAVSRMLHKLKERELVDFHPYGTVALTPRGEQLGARLLQRHRLLTEFFSQFTPPEQLLTQVEMAEHFLLPETLCGIQVFLEREGPGQRPPADG